MSNDCETCVSIDVDANEPPCKECLRGKIGSGYQYQKRGDTSETK